MHILWINEHADFTGGCERYVAETASLLTGYDVRSTLLYDVTAPASPSFYSHFTQAFPLADLPLQLKKCAPDLIYIHRLRGQKVLKACSDSAIPVFRFFHDHRLFCLREHKYTTLRHVPCRRVLGWRCYPCLGWVNRGNKPRRIHIRTLHTARKELQAQHELDGCIVGSRYMANHIIAHGIKPDTVHVIPPYASLPDDDVKNREHDRQMLLFVGQLVRGKGIDILLKALSRMSMPCTLVIVGKGRQEHMFRRMAQAQGVASSVLWAGHCTPTELSRYYRKARCVVFPTRAETFGLVGPESMRYGTPVVASDVGGVREWLAHDVNGLLVPPVDPPALAATLTRILTEDKLVARLGRAAREQYYARFTPHRHCTDLMNLFHTYVQ